MRIRKMMLIVIPFFLFPAIMMGQQQNPDTTKNVRQRDLLEFFSKYIKFKKRKIPRERKVFFSFLPISGASTNGNSFIVSSINATFNLGSSQTTNLSSIYFIPYTNLSTRFGFIIKPNVYLHDNQWNMNGDLRIIHNDVETYGLGGATTDEDADLVSNAQIRLYLNANRKIIDNFYMGFGYNLDHFYNIHENWTGTTPSAFKQYGIGTGSSSTTSGIGPNFVFDSRANLNNPIDGYYSSLSLRLNPGFLGSSSGWTSIYFDNRKYIPLSDHWHSVLAFWAVYWGTYGDVPYLDLPTTAGDVSEKLGRGYVRWRYRGKQLLYGEAEYRFDITANGLFGGVVFSNVESFTEPTTNNFSHLLPAIGLGLRVKFNKKSNVNVTLDFAVGKDSFDWHLSLGEFF